MGQVIDVQIYPIRQVPVIQMDKNGNVCIRLIMEALKITEEKLKRGGLLDGTTHTK